MGKFVLLALCLFGVASAFWSPFWAHESTEMPEYNATEEMEWENTTTTRFPKVDSRVNPKFLKLMHRPDLVSLARKLNLTRFVQHLHASGLDRVINHERNFTVFAPSDEAYRNAPLYCKYAPEESAVRFLVAKGSHSTVSFKNELRLRTLLSHRDIRINLYNDSQTLTASGMRLGRTDFKARNGIIHIIDDMSTCSIPKGTIPQEMKKCPMLRTMSAAINKTSVFRLLNQTNPLTVFVPTDRAFRLLPNSFLQKMFNNQELLKKIVLHHAVPRSLFTEGILNNQKVKTLQGTTLELSKCNENNDIKVENATIVARDVNAINGVIQGIDRVLLPKNVVQQYGLQDIIQDM